MSKKGTFIWLKGHFHHLLESLVSGLVALRDRRVLILTIFQTLLLWAVTGTATFLVLLAFNVHLSVTQVVFVLGFEMIGSVVPTPGGAAGAFHTAAQTSLVLLGVEKNLAASCAIILHLATFGPALFFGILFTIRHGFSVSALRKLDEDLSEHPERVVFDNSKETST